MAPARFWVTRSRPMPSVGWWAGAVRPSNPHCSVRSSRTWATSSPPPARPALPRSRWPCTTTRFRRRSTTRDQIPTSTSTPYICGWSKPPPTGRATADTRSPVCPASVSAAPTHTWFCARCWPPTSSNQNQNPKPLPHHRRPRSPKPCTSAVSGWMSTASSSMRKTPVGTAITISRVMMSNLRCRASPMRHTDCWPLRARN